jgi:endoglucanase
MTRLTHLSVTSMALVAALAAVPSCGGAQKPPAAPSGEFPPDGKLSNLKPGELKKDGENPFTGAQWYVAPYGNALTRQRMAERAGNAEEAALMAKIASHGGADWVGDWTAYVGDWVRRQTTVITKAGALPLYVAYNLPHRDCGAYSAGGVETGADYRQWITDFARGINDRRAVVVLEPDGLGLLDKCLSPEQQEERLELFRFAVDTFNQLPATYVYIDAGHSGWMTPEVAAERLQRAGVADAAGFALNTSNYRATDELLAYGKEISAQIGGKHFVIDTSRNGNGPPTVDDPSSEQSWCNPPGRALGSPPTTDTADPSCDAYLWLKKPGESDGACNGGPKAGEWWQEQALELARNAKF